MHFNGKIKITLFFLFSCLIFIQDAHAYLDPGTGSYILQLLIAAFIGGIFALKLFWNNIKNFLKKLFHWQGKNE